MRLRKVDLGPVPSGTHQMRRVVGRVSPITPVMPRADQLRRPSRHISRPVAGAIWVPNPAARTLRHAACAPFARARGGGTRSRYRTVSLSPKPTPPRAHAQPTPRDMAPQGADHDASGGYTTGAFLVAKEGAARACAAKGRRRGCALRYSPDAARGGADPVDNALRRLHTSSFHKPRAHRSVRCGD